jgi:Surface antigen variable number repeat
MRICQVMPSLIAVVFLTGWLSADCGKGQDHRSNKSGGVQVTDFTITGTRDLSSGDLDALTSKMIGGCYDDDSDQLEEQVRALFQDRGYFRAEVKSLHVLPSDPLKVPKPVKLEAEVDEGSRYRVREITFTGNHHFASGKLRKAFSLKNGDLFDRSLAAGGLEGVRKLYVSDGYLEIVMIPNVTNITEPGLDLNVEVREGTQYHMGKLDVFAKKEIADRLRVDWGLAEGAVYDPAYVDKFLDDHHALLPAGFTRQDVQTVLDCPDATVEVRLIVDAIEAALHPTKPVTCEASDKAP